MSFVGFNNEVIREENNQHSRKNKLSVKTNLEVFSAFRQWVLLCDVSDY